MPRWKGCYHGIRCANPKGPEPITRLPDLTFAPSKFESDLVRAFFLQRLTILFCGFLTNRGRGSRLRKDQPDLFLVRLPFRQHVTMTEDV